MTIRAITNMSVKLDKAPKANTEEDVITNALLYKCFYVIKTAFTSYPEALGFGIRSKDDIYSKLKAFKAHAAPTVPTVPAPSPHSPSQCPAHPSSAPGNNHQPQFYVACLDLERCFDNIDPKRLYDMVVQLIAKYTLLVDGQESTTKESINAVITDPNYTHMIHKYSVTQYFKSKARLQSKSIRYVTPNDLLHFQDASKQVAAHVDNAIILDGVIHPVISNVKLLKLLKQHLFSHMVQMQNSDGSYSEFTQMIGIPQGSILSPLLCNIYYGNIEQHEFVSKPLENTVVMRQMDDYLVISTDQQEITRLIQTMFSVLRRFNGKLSVTKSSVNFDLVIETEGEKVALPRMQGKDCTWCGLLIDTTTLEVRHSYDRLLVPSMIVSSLVMDYHKLGLSLRRSLTSFMRSRSHILYVSAAINTTATIAETVYNIFKMSAMRLHAHFTKSNYQLIRRNHKFLVALIVDVISYGTRLSHGCLKRKRPLDLQNPQENVRYTLDDRVGLSFAMVSFLEFQSYSFV